MIRMKALRSFGVASANEGKVRRGREFTVASEQRARDLEDAGLAYRVKMEPKPQNKMEPPPQNKAAEEGPFVSRGGGTGAENSVPSSPEDRPLPKRRGRPPSRRSESEQES